MAVVAVVQTRKNGVVVSSKMLTNALKESGRPQRSTRNSAPLYRVSETYCKSLLSLTCHRAFLLELGVGG